MAFTITPSGLINLAPGATQQFTSNHNPLPLVEYSPGTNATEHPTTLGAPQITNIGVFDLPVCNTLVTNGNLSWIWDSAGLWVGIELIDGTNSYYVGHDLSAPANSFVMKFNGAIVDGPHPMNPGDTFDLAKSSNVINASLYGTSTLTYTFATTSTATPTFILKGENVSLGANAELSPPIANGNWAIGDVWSTMGGSGSITPSGLFTATTTPGTYPAGVKATSDCATVASATILIAGSGITGPTSVNSCSLVNYSVDGASGLTWTSSNALAGTINPTTGVFTAANLTSNQTTVITATSGGGFSASLTITVLPVSPITSTGPGAATYVGGMIQYAHATPGGTWSAMPTNSITSTGLFTPTTTGTYTIKYTLPGGSCEATKTIQVYAQMSVTPQIGANSCYSFKVRETQVFSLSGGSGSEIWSTTCSAGSITQDGAFTAPSTPQNCAVTVTDTVTGQVINLPICMEAPQGICIIPIEDEIGFDVQPDQCCEISLDCGDATNLAVPGLTVTIPAVGIKTASPTWTNKVLVQQTEPFALLTALADGAGAYGDTIPAGGDGRVDFILNASNIAGQTQPTVIGWSDRKTDTIYSSIGWGIGVNTAGQLEIFENGISVNGTFGAATDGTSLSVIVLGGKVYYQRNGQPLYESLSSPCSDLYLHASIGKVGGSISGGASATWSILTAGGPTSVGTISPSGTYRAPDAPGDIVVQASISGSIWTITLHVNQPTPFVSNPADFWEGGCELWLATGYIKPGQAPRLAKNGSPDAGSSPNAINIGETVDGVKISYTPEFAERRSDRGIYRRSLSNERALIAFTMLEVRNVEKLRHVVSTMTVGKVNGYQTLGFGGKKCACEMSVLLVKPTAGDCTSGTYDVIAFHRVVAIKGLEMAFSSQGRVEAPVELEVLLDSSRPSGEQLFTIYKAIDCSKSANSGCAIG